MARTPGGNVKKVKKRIKRGGWPPRMKIPRDVKVTFGDPEGNTNAAGQFRKDLPVPEVPDE